MGIHEDTKRARELAAAFSETTYDVSLELLGKALREELLRVFPLTPTTDAAEPDHCSYLEGREAYKAAPAGTVVAAADGGNTLTKVGALWHGGVTGPRLSQDLDVRRRVVKWGEG